MARLFDDAQSEYLIRSEAVLNATPLAMVCWFRSDSETVGQVLMCLSNIGTNVDRFVLNARGDIVNDPVGCDINTSGGGTGFYTTTSYSINTWEHACAIFAASDDRRVLLNAGGKNTNSVSRTPDSGEIITTGIGVLTRLDKALYMSGMIAEAAIYDLSVWPGATNALKADAFEGILPGLVKGFSPLCYPLGLEAYWPLIRGLNDKVGGYNLTATGTVVSNHPRIILPHGPL